MANRTPLELLLAQVNSDNPDFPRLLTPTNCLADAPVTLSGDASGKNTSVLITGVAGQGVKDMVTVKYDRLSLAQLIAASSHPTGDLPNQSQATLDDFVTSFNTYYGTRLLTSELVANAPEAVTGGYLQVALTPVDDHYLYTTDTSVVRYKQSFPTLTVSGTYDPNLVEGEAYSSALTIAGGNGTYLNPQVASGTLPPGLSVSVVDDQLILSGTVGTLGPSYTFTLTVDSDDGQTAVAPAQSFTFSLNLASLITVPSVGALTLADLQAQA